MNNEMFTEVVYSNYVFTMGVSDDVINVRVNCDVFAIRVIEYRICS